MRKLALLHVQCQASFLETEQNSPQTYIMFNLIPTMDKDVVHSAYYTIKTLQDSVTGKFTFPLCVIRNIFIRKLSHLTISGPFILIIKKCIKTTVAFEIFVVTRFHHMHLLVGTFVIYYMVFLGKYKC